MLTSDLIRPRLRMNGSSISVEQVGEHDLTLQQTASDLITLFRSYTGQPRYAWEKALDTFIGTRIDYVVIRGLAKVLTDSAVFTPRSTPIPPTTLREQAWAFGPVFRKPGLFHTRTRQEVIEEIASPLLQYPLTDRRNGENPMPLPASPDTGDSNITIPNRSSDFALGFVADDLTTLLYADRQVNYLLTDPGPTWTAEALLARYNLELARGVLYWASHMTIEASSNYKDLWHFMKLFKLMFIGERTPTGGYHIDLDGPISPFVSSTLRYGRQFAAFLPALLLCEQWQMRAQVLPPQAQKFLTYQLDHTCTLRTHFKGSGPFDSRLEADFASAFATKMGEKRGHWLLARESDVLLLGDTVMIPDFVLTDERDEQRKVLVELVGFWHPDYLRRKVEKVRAAQCAHMLLLVSDYLNLTDQDFDGSLSEVLFFHEKPVLKDVMAAVEAIAMRVYGPPPPKVRKQPTKPKEKKSRQTRRKKAEVPEDELTTTHNEEDTPPDAGP